ncbi:MAG: methyltransferase domain-containing protein [Actinophytocola sp.]|nr:methyltransferase domain-containing protein [Actinophytocola sp.]
MSTGFVAGEQQWRARMGTLRQVVRQELVARQLAAHLPDNPPRRVLDVGCGQGTQILRLARRGHDTTGLDSSDTLLADLEAALALEPGDVRQRVRTVLGDAEHLTELFPRESFDVVLCHGVLMYFTEPGPLLDAIGVVVRPGGLVSLLVRNGDALALRPGLQRDWPTTLRAFDDMSYGNRIGVRARADRRVELTAALAQRGLAVHDWFGVRVLTDTLPFDTPVPDDDRELEALLACEERAGTTEPHRSSQQRRPDHRHRVHPAAQAEPG